jgi:hypothetical protein
VGTPAKWTVAKTVSVGRLGSDSGKTTDHSLVLRGGNLTAGPAAQEHTRSSLRIDNRSRRGRLH